MSESANSAQPAVAGSGDVTFPVSEKLTINYSPYEDRLIVKAPRRAAAPVTLLLTRRMTVLILQQMLSRLAELSGLGKTPAEYWQEVLQMTHQQAMASKVKADQTAKASSEAAASAQPAAASTADAPDSIYLATELTIQVKEQQLTLAFKGLPMPKAMTQAAPHEPVLAIPLQLDNVHQLIELLINRAAAAHWHLPVDLPWLSAEQTFDSSAGARRDN